MWPPIYQCFESHSCLYTEFTVAGEEKCMLNSASANTVQGIQGACTTSPSFSKIQKCIHTLDKSRQSITGHSNWFIQNRPLPVQSERIPRYKLSLSSFIPGCSHVSPPWNTPVLEEGGSGTVEGGSGTGRVARELRRVALEEGVSTLHSKQYAEHRLSVVNDTG